MRVAVFLDRDGVLNKTVVRDGAPRPPASAAELELLPGVEEATRRLAGAGLALIVVTNQPDVARGAQSRERVEEINDLLLRRLPLLDVYTCYHDDADGCACRKPRPGMLLAAARARGIDPGRSFMVGDRWSDVAAGQAAGCFSILIARPYSEAGRCRPELCAGDLGEAAEQILSLTRGRS
jgi:D-glycero-D-manno-heptose 1,7-bisphosphate phosphatase